MLSYQYMLLRNGDGWEKLRFIKLGMVYIGPMIGLKIKENDMQLWKTKYIAKKPVTRVEQENNFAPGIWVPEIMAKCPMDSLEDGY